ncbi:hypothetical protein E4T56_gene18582 [Termitomyces sp. T112]|nr:hypothetical protein E4T56_gene18582 [Termitomyces sp. T112]
MNGYLAQIDKATADMAAVDGVPPIPPKTMIRGVKPLERATHDPDWELAMTCLDSSARVADKAHNLIVRFVPCGGIFDPSKAADIATFKCENDQVLSLQPPG